MINILTYMIKSQSFYINLMILLSFYNLLKVYLKKEVYMTTLSKLVGKRIRELREEKNIKQVELAEMIDMEPTNLSKLEKGVHLPKEVKLTKITQALGIQVKDLFDFSGIKSKENLLKDIHSILAVN